MYQVLVPEEEAVEFDTVRLSTIHYWVKWACLVAGLFGAFALGCFCGRRGRHATRERPSMRVRLVQPARVHVPSTSIVGPGEVGGGGEINENQ